MEMSKMGNRNQTTHKIWIFVAGVCLCGWIGKLIDMGLTDQPQGQSLGSLIWLVTPAIMSSLLGLIFERKNKRLGLRMNFRGNIWVYMFALLLFPILTIAILFFGYLCKLVVLQNYDLYKILLVFMIWFAINFFRTILEEIAWRGYLTERLLQLELSDWIIYAIVTLVWGTWHIPYYLFFYQNGNSLLLILSCYFNLACWSILFTEIYRRTKSIWPCILLHAAANAVQYLMLDNNFVISDQWNILLAPGTGILSCTICVIAGLVIRGNNRKLQGHRNE
jgi:membrane protease YdiL (CAAX protease family)